MNRIIKTVCYFVLLLGIATASLSARDGTTVVIDVAELRLLSPTALYSGTVISKNDARLAAEVEGRLTWIADIGTVLKKNEVIARLDDTFLHQQRSEELATIQSEKAKLELYNKEVKRYQKLVKQNNIAENQLDQAISDQSVARNNIDAARARLAQIDERIARSVLRAPFSGVISERFAQIGEWSQGGTTLVRLVDTTNLEVQVRVPQSIFTLIQIGDTLVVHYEDEPIKAGVKTIVPVGSSSSRLFELRLLPSKALPPGTLVRVSIPTSRAREVVSVHRDALVLRKNRVSVFRVNEKEVAEQISVQVGIGDGDYIELIGEIDAGDRIVIRGGERLRPGVPVTVTSINTRQ